MSKIKKTLSIKKHLIKAVRMSSQLCITQNIYLHSKMLQLRVLTCFSFIHFYELVFRWVVNLYSTSFEIVPQLTLYYQDLPKTNDQPFHHSIEFSWVCSVNWSSSRLVQCAHHRFSSDVVMVLDRKTRQDSLNNPWTAILLCHTLKGALHLMLSKNRTCSFVWHIQNKKMNFLKLSTKLLFHWPTYL